MGIDAYIVDVETHMEGNIPFGASYSIGCFYFLIGHIFDDIISG
jgi:hypothetical protein